MNIKTIFGRCAVAPKAGEASPAAVTQLARNVSKSAHLENMISKKTFGADSVNEVRDPVF